MKLNFNLQSFLKKHNLKKTKNFFTAFLSIIVVISVVSSLITPAVSMTRIEPLLTLPMKRAVDDDGYQMLHNAAGENGNVVDGKVYSPAEMKAITLLIGDGYTWTNGCTTVDDVIERAKDEYFLGIAHDFCAFIENDFNPKAADAEGRVAIGGDITFVEEGNPWNYQIGSGDYAAAKALNHTVNYDNVTGYAHAIIGGKMVNINTASTGSGVKKYGGENDYDINSGNHIVNKGNQYSYTFFYKPDEDLFKRFVVGDIENSSHYEYKTNNNVEYEKSHAHDYPGDCEKDENGEDKIHPYLGRVNELSQIYNQPEGGLINFDETFAFLRERSKLLSMKKSTGNVKVEGETVTLTCPQGTKAGDTVYFNIPEWGSNKYKTFRYNNVPCGNMDDEFGTSQIYPLCNIVVNCPGTKFEMGSAAEAEKIETFINDIHIHADSEWENNHPASEKLLYNFYEATTGEIKASFNGTILAPLADVTSKPDINRKGEEVRGAAAGHLSGALIAKSFEGFLEFGYKPYRGPAEILGTVSGYTVPVDKFSTAKNENGTNQFLPGATLSLYDEENELLTAWVSGDSTKYAPIPTAVDYSGDTDYTDETEFPRTNNSIVLTKQYKLEETSAPEGYFKGENYYEIVVKETIDTNYLITGSSKCFPQKVDVEVKITEVDTNKKAEELMNETLNFTVKNVYTTEGSSALVQRRIYVKDEDGNVTDAFVLDMTSDSAQTVSKAYRILDGELKDINYGDTETTVKLPGTVTLASVASDNQGGNDQSTDNSTTAATRTKTYTWSTTIAACDQNNPNKHDIPPDVNGNITKIEFDVITNSDNSTCNGALIAYTKDENGNYNQVDRNNLTYNNDTKIATFTINGEAKKIDAIAVVTYDNNNSYSAENIRITYNSPSTFTVTPESANLIVGDSTNLTITGATGEIHWSCDRDSGWSISGNTLTVTKPGTYNITGTDSDLDDEGHGKTGTFTVNVAPFAITADKSSVKNGESITLTANKSADWSISGDNIAELTSDAADPTKCVVKVNEEGSGTATITAKYTAANNQEYSATATINIPKPNTDSKKVNRIDGSNLEELAIDTSSSQKIGESCYYLKDSIMVMPLPSKSLEFINKPGLLFKKVNEDGNELKGAQITLTGGSVPEGVWTWNKETSSKLIDVGKLDTNTEYVFTEKAAPNTYELADPIRFKVSGNQIEYWSGDNANHTTVDLPCTIKMTDVKKKGVIPDLEKVHKKLGDDGNETEDLETLPGATIELYAKDDTKIFTWDKFPGKKTSMKEKLAGVTDSPYVIDGYLVPGVYYLKETTIPECGTGADAKEHKDPGKMYFTVTDDFVIQNGYSSVIRIETGSVDAGWGDGTNEKYPVINGKSFGNAAEGEIPNVVSLVLRGNKNADQWYCNLGESKNNDDEYSISNIDPPQTLNKVFAYAKDFEFTYIEIKTSDGTTYLYDNNASSIDNDDHINSALNVSDSTLKVINKLPGNYTDITVEKKWVGDELFNEKRTEVEYKLYKTTEEIKNKSKAELNALISSGAANEVTPIPETFRDEDANKTYTNPTELKLNTNNNWTQTIYGLDNKNANGENLHYFVIEKNINGYDASYEFTNSTCTITNTLKTISLNAEKEWNVPDDLEIEKPDAVVFKVQKKNGNLWVDVPGKEITLTAENNWQGEVDGLPDGETYRFVEKLVPNGWKCNNAENASDSSNEGGTTLKITNSPKTSGIEIQKKWEGDNKDNRPDKIKVALYRKAETNRIRSPKGALWPNDTYYAAYNEQNPESNLNVKNDYARLLQYSLYFYDGLMCGTNVDENSNYFWRSDCHTDDDVPGGFHDAGDHAMFGLPAGFSASNLGWSLYEFRDDYDDLGQTAHTKLITDYYADFFSKCAKLDSNGNISEILVQKGHGNTDHAYWGIPELQDSRMDPVTMTAKNNVQTGWPGGEKTIDNEMYWRSDTGSDIAAEYAASLALSYLNFGGDDSKYNGYLEMAKKFYDYSTRVNSSLNERGVNIDEWDKGGFPGFYKSDGHNDEQAWAACWLALACKKAANYNENDSEYLKYKGDANNKANALDKAWGGYHWNNVHDGAMLVNAAHLGGSWDNVVGVAGTDGDKSVDLGNKSYKEVNEWGQSRYNCGFQTIVLLLAKYNKINENQAKEWCKSQMNFILGENSSGYCFVTNFSENSTQKPHFRAGAGKRYNMENKDDPAIIDGYDEDLFRLIGGLVGGPKNNSAGYEDRRGDFQKNEVASDYNANLIGAAAGLYHFYKSGHTVLIPGVKTQYVTSDTNSNELFNIQKQNEQISASPQSQSAAVFGPQPLNIDFGSVSVAGANKAVRILDAGSERQLVREITKNDIVFEIDKEIDLSEFNLNDITYVEVSFSYSRPGGWEGANGNFNFNGTEQVNFNYSDNYKSEISFDSPKNISNFKVHCDWNDANIQFESIKFYIKPNNSFPVTPSSAELIVGDEIQLSVSSDITVTKWTSSDESVATVDSNGKVTAIGAGEATITATGSDGKTGTCKIKVEEFNITENEADVELTGTVTLHANAPANWSADSDKVELTPSSDRKSCTVKALSGANTSVTITATAGGKTDTATINIKPKPNIYKLKIEKLANPGDEIDLTKISELNGCTITKIEIRGSGKDDGNGGISFNGEGNKQFYAKDLPYTVPNDWYESDNLKKVKVDNYYELYNIEIWFYYDVPQKLNVSSNKSELLPGDTANLTVKNSDGTELTGVTWSVKDNNGSISGNTYEAGGKSGTVTIEAEKDGVKGTVELTIKPIEVEKYSVSIREGDISKINKIELKENYGGTITYQSNKPTVATVDDSGEITAVSKGDANITVCRNGVATECIIAVNVVGAMTIVDNNDSPIPDNSLNVPIKNTVQLKTHDSAGSVTWESSDPSVVSVDKNTGIITALDFGRSTIKATDEQGGTAEITVTVPQQGILPDIPEGAEQVGGIIELNAANNWTYSNSNLPQCDENGNRYCYYIVELDPDDHNQPARQINGKNNIKYLPILYENNGNPLTDDEITLSVTNKAVQSPGGMPSTGGTGVRVYYYFGGIMTLSAASIILYKRRRKRCTK